MDTVRGNFGPIADDDGFDPGEGEVARKAPLRPAIGQDERRMQVRAYNHWASLLEERNYPAIEELEPENLPDFGPYSVLLDFSAGIENPGVAFIGEKLAEECGVGDGELATLADVPARSLLTRITDHYMQILANQAPIGFEAEFVNQRGAALAYRGILLPYSSDDDTIDFIYGVINWKELPDAQDSDELLLEVDQVLEARLDPIGANIAAQDGWADEEPDALPMPSFGLNLSGKSFAEEDEEDETALDEENYPDAEDEYDDDEETGNGSRGPSFGSLLRMPIQSSDSSAKVPIELGDPLDDAEFDLSGYIDSEALAMPAADPSTMGLADWLAAAREMADAANNSEDRTRSALYEAIGRAYDFSLAAIEAPSEFGELLADAQLTVQARAPMTPVVKLVFGHDYDKTRLTEYAAALTHAHRIELPRGTLSSFLREFDGGLKGVVNAERQLRREEAGKEPVDAREALAAKLRAMPPLPFNSIAPEGSEFALVMIRRTGDGGIAILGEIPEDLPLIERAAKRLIR